MGRWQFEYYDQVLGQKLKSLVTGAIERAKLEQDEPDATPAITYERFVQDLDHGDSFTTTLVEILVKELAERQNRPTPADRHLVSERTVKNLHTLAARRPFRDPSGTRDRRERSFILRRHFPDFFVSNNNGGSSLEWDVIQQNMDDDDDIISVDDFTTPGPYRSNPSDSGPSFTMFPDSTTRRSSQVVQTDTDEEIMIPESSRRSPPTIPRPIPTRQSTLTRQSSIRRTARPRPMGDASFGDFTTRRRLVNRLEQNAQANAEESNARSSGSASAEPSSSSMDLANLLNSHYAAARANSGNSEEPESAMPVAAYTSATSLARRGLSRLRSQLEGQTAASDTLPSPRYLMLHQPGNASSSSAAPSASRLTVNVPRLRRGGIRAPESLPVAGDGYAHSVRISSPPIPGLLTTQEREERSNNRRAASAPTDDNTERVVARMMTSPPYRPFSPAYHHESWSPPYRTASPSEETLPIPVTRSMGAREPEGTLNDLPTPRSISPEDSSSTSQQNGH